MDGGRGAVVVVVLRSRYDVEKPCGAGDFSRELSARETSHPTASRRNGPSVLWVSCPDPLG